MMNSMSTYRDDLFEVVMKDFEDRHVVCSVVAIQTTLWKSHMRKTCLKQDVTNTFVPLCNNL